MRLVLILLVICGVAVLSFGLIHRSPATTAGAPAPRPTASASPVVIETLTPAQRPNTWLTNGAMQYVVAGQDCGLPSIGTATKPRNGQFCEVTVRVRNRSKQPVVFAPSDQVGYTPTGQRYAADAAATRYANGSARTFLTPLPPFQVVTGALVFDLPAGVTLSTLRLRSTAVPGAVTVSFL